MAVRIEERPATAGNARSGAWGTSRHQVVAPPAKHCGAGGAGAARRWAIGVTALSLLVGACASDADRTVGPSPAPTVSDATVVDGFPLGVYGAGVDSGSVAFGAYAEFYEDGTGRVRGPAGNSSSTL